MSNLYMLGLVRLDHFNIRSSIVVIGFFGIVTIISYFNELNKAGLLRRGAHPRPIPHYLVHPRPQRAGEGDTIIQKNGNLHHLGLEIMHIKEDVKKTHHKDTQEINIRVNLGRNSSYEKLNNSVVPVYSHRNTLPNYFTTLNSSSFSSIDSNHFLATHSSGQNVTSISAFLKEVEDRKRQYKKAVVVYMYQHDPGAYMLRDCLKNIIHIKKLAANKIAIGFGNRKQWDQLGKRKRNTFQVVYGSRTFGLCESLNRPCNYMTLVSHPLDRLVILYEFCKSRKNESNVLCQVNQLNTAHITLQEFAKAQGSSLFQSLVYYSKHCRLIGEDEVCLQDSRTSFVVSPEEMSVHLKHVVGHLEAWFANIALIDRLNESLAMLQELYDYPFSPCEENTMHLYGPDAFMKKPPSWLPWVHPKQVKSLTDQQRALLLNDAVITAALHADLEIYKKFVEIYERQVAGWKLLHLMKKAEYDWRESNRPMTVSRQNKTDKVRMKTSKALTNAHSKKRVFTNKTKHTENKMKENYTKSNIKEQDKGNQTTKTNNRKEHHNHKRKHELSPKQHSRKRKIPKITTHEMSTSRSTISVLGMDSLLYQGFPKTETGKQMSTTEHTKVSPAKVTNRNIAKRQQG